MSSINDQIVQATNELRGFNQGGCFTITFCAIAIVNKLQNIILVIDKKIGDLGIKKIAEFIADTIEIFCKYFNIDIKDFQNFTAISESIQDFISTITSSLKVKNI